MATFQTQSQFLPVGGNVNMGASSAYTRPASYGEPSQIGGVPNMQRGVPDQPSMWQPQPPPAPAQFPAGGAPSPQQPQHNQQSGPNGNAWGWRRRQGLSTWKPGMPWQRGQRPGQNLANVMIGGSQAAPQRPQINPDIMQQLLDRRMAERGLGGRGEMGFGDRGGMGGFQGRPQQAPPLPQYQDYYPQPMPPSYQQAPMSGGFYAGPQQAMGFQQEQPFDLYDMMGNWG